MTPERLNTVRHMLHTHTRLSAEDCRSIALELLSALGEGLSREVKLAERLRGASMGYHYLDPNCAHPGFWEECAHDTCTGDRAVLNPDSLSPRGDI